MNEIGFLEKIVTEGSDEFLSILKALLTSEPTMNAYRLFIEEEKHTAFTLNHELDCSWQHTYWVLRRLKKLGLITQTGIKIHYRGPHADAIHEYKLQNPLLKETPE